jgi:HEAT repeat protein
MSKLTGPRLIRVFLSSPGDVSEERDLTRAIIKDLQYDPFLRGNVAFEVVSWDDPSSRTPLLANLTPHQAIERGLPRPSECDFVVVILWGRFGTPLADSVRKSNGERYLSGTEWEFEDAISAKKPPVILIYRRMEKVLLDADDPELQLKLEQREYINKFFKKFINADGSYKAGVNTYDAPHLFGERLKSDLRILLSGTFSSTPLTVSIRPTADGSTLALSTVAIALTKALREDGVAEVAIGALAKMGPTAATSVPELANILLYGPENIRKHAADALVRVGSADGQTVRLLTDALRRDGLAHIAIGALEKMGPAAAAAVPGLAEILGNHRYKDVWKDAVETLVQIGSDDRLTVEVLSGALRHDGLEKIAISALEKIGPGAAAAVPELANILRSRRYEDLWEDTVVALLKIGSTDERTVQVLIEALGNDGLKQVALRALGTIGPAAAAAVPKLTNILRDPRHKDVWGDTVGALVQIGSAEGQTVQTLTKALREDGLRRIAVGALAKMGPAAAVAVSGLAAILRNPSHKDVWKETVDALVQIGSADGQTVQALIDALSEDGPKQIAIGALGKMGPAAAEAVPRLASLLTNPSHKDVWKDTVDALVQIGSADGQTVHALVEALREDDLKQIAIGALGKIGPAAAAAARDLGNILKNDRSIDVRRDAADALARIGAHDSFATLSLIDALGEEPLRQSGRDALSRIGAESAEALVSALLNPNKDVRMNAAYILGEIYKT